MAGDKDYIQVRAHGAKLFNESRARVVANRKIAKHRPDLFSMALEEIAGGLRSLGSQNFDLEKSFNHILHKSGHRRIVVHNQHRVLRPVYVIAAHTNLCKLCPVRIFKSARGALSLTRFAGGEFPDEGRRALKFWLCGLCCGQGAEFMDKYNVAELKPEDVIWETKVIAIEGMTCDNCVKHVTKALRGVNGVKSVEVDRENARAIVTYDTTKTDIPPLDDALKKGGYRARPFAAPE